MHGRIDVIINNAGLMPHSPVERAKIQDWNRMIDANLPASCARSFARPLRTLGGNLQKKVTAAASMALIIGACGSRIALIPSAVCPFSWKQAVEAGGLPKSAAAASDFCPSLVIMGSSSHKSIQQD
jgi:NAD(P)-dependent dehydrogenase (short-subunit alcohol dehydrogenase family)